MSAHWIFAYGSNMHVPDLTRWLRQSGLEDRAAGLGQILPARLPEWGLVWNYRSPSRRGAAANVEPRPGDEVRGLVLHVDEGLLRAIDRKEGHPHRYSRGGQPRRVITLSEERPVRAWVYQVAMPWRQRIPVRPRRGYLGLMIDAAVEHALGDDWVERLRRVATED